MFVVEAKFNWDKAPMNSLLQFLTQSFAPILQNELFPILREQLGAMSERHEQFVRALAMLQLDGFVVVRHGRGRRPHDRASMARAFLAKAVFNFPHTRALLDRLQIDTVLRRLCGWETAAQVPDETVFSRAFAEFAKSEFPQRVHAALVQRTQGERLIGHILRDSTAIEAREKPQPKVAAPTPPPSRRSHHKTKKPKSPEQMTRLDRQCSGTMTLEQMLSELPRACDVGCKTNSKGSKHFWIGYKLHLDVADGQIPISCVLTAASLNDTQAAVPLSLLTAQRVTSLYDLMDMGYDSQQIREHSAQLGHVPLIPKRKCGSQQPVMAPHEQIRFRERTGVERVYARLKDEFGGQFVRVRGWAKVMAHLMFGILALTADQILRWGAPPNTESPPLAA
jgi:IS5 family transposase